MQTKIISILIASALAAIVIFFYGFVAFNVIPSPQWMQRAFPKDSSAIAELEKLDSGTYIYPHGEHGADMKEITDKMEAGPIFTLYINDGTLFNLGLSMAEEVARAFLAALVVSILLSLVHSNLCCYSHRVFFVSLCGLFAAIACEPTYSIWYWRSCGTTTWMFCSTVVGWTLAGFVIAYFVKPWNNAGPDKRVEIGK